jgi:hypothetical protein
MKYYYISKGTMVYLFKDRPAVDIPYQPFKAERTVIYLEAERVEGPHETCDTYYYYFALPFNDRGFNWLAVDKKYVDEKNPELK